MYTFFKALDFVLSLIQHFLSLFTGTLQSQTVKSKPPINQNQSNISSNVPVNVNVNHNTPTTIENNAEINFK